MKFEEDENISTSTSEFIRKYEIHKLHYDLLDRLMFIIAAGLGLIAALAWDDVLHSFFIQVFGFLGEPLSRLGYAVTLTILATLMAVIFRKVSKRKRKIR